MIDSFSDVVSKMRYHLQHKEEGYAIPLMPKYNSVIGNILPAQYTVITGLQSSGKTSFVDENYVLNILLQRNKLEEKPPLKIFYFSLKDTSLKKFQSLLCAYVKLVHNYRVDIPTLNSQPGRLFDIEKEPTILATIDDAEIFFNEVIDEQVLQVVTNVSRPTAIYTTVMEYLDTIEDEHERPLVMVIIDSTDHLSPESDGYRTLQGVELDYKFNSYMSQLVKERNVHAVVITPAHGANSRFPKENEPNYRQLGVYGCCDKGVVLYNPIGENNGNYLRAITDFECYISPSGLNTLRFWHVVKNVDGIESVSDRLLFMPGTSYMLEVSMQEQIDSFLTVKDLLYNVGLNPFYKRPAEPDTEVAET
jgi:hypothetical protein